MFLRDLRVLDLGSYVAGPAAATVLSDFGADVVKVEPLDGDPYRKLLGGVLAEYPNFFSQSISARRPGGKPSNAYSNVATWSSRTTARRC